MYTHFLRNFLTASGTHPCIVCRNFSKSPGTHHLYFFEVPGTERYAHIFFSLWLFECTRYLAWCYFFVTYHNHPVHINRYFFLKHPVHIVEYIFFVTFWMHPVHCVICFFATVTHFYFSESPVNIICIFSDAPGTERYTYIFYLCDFSKPPGSQHGVIFFVTYQRHTAHIYRYFFGSTVLRNFLNTLGMQRCVFRNVLKFIGTF